MISRYCIPELLALGALLANLQLQGCSAAAFNCGPKTISGQSRRKPPTTPVRCSAPGNSMIYLHARNAVQQPLFATINGKQEDSATSKRKGVLNMLSLRKMTSSKHARRMVPSEAEDGTKSKEDVQSEAGPFHVTSVDELNDYYNDERGRFRKKKR